MLRENSEKFHDYVPTKKLSIYDQLVLHKSLISLDVDAFRREVEKFGMSLHGQDNESVLKTMHLARIKLNHATVEQKRASEEFLRLRGIDWR